MTSCGYSKVDDSAVHPAELVNSLFLAIFVLLLTESLLTEMWLFMSAAYIARYKHTETNCSFSTTVSPLATFGPQMPVLMCTPHFIYRLTGLLAVGGLVLYATLPHSAAITLNSIISVQSACSIGVPHSRDLQGSIV